MIVAISSLRPAQRSDQVGRFVAIESTRAVDSPVLAGTSSPPASPIPNSGDGALPIGVAAGDGPPPPHPLKIAGRVVDAEKRPQIGWIVQLARSGSAVFETTLQMPRIQTDGMGQFEITDLAGGDHVLSAIHPEFFLRFDSGAIRAGTSGVEIVLPEEPFIRRLHGRVVLRDGTMANGVSIAVQVRATPDGFPPRSLVGLETKSGREGEFELRNVPRQDSIFLAWREDGRSAARAISELDASAELEIVLERHHFLRVQGPFPEAKDLRLAVRDSRGIELLLSERDSSDYLMSKRARVRSSKSFSCYASEAAVEFGLFDGEESLGFRPLRVVEQGLMEGTW